MDYFSTSLYGTIQGVTEFLPVSSSGHLALLPKLLGISDPGMFFDLSMHLGTAMAVTVYYRDEILDILKAFFRLFKFEGTNYPNKFFALNMFISTLSTFIAVLLIKKFALSVGRTSLFIGINLIVFGALMYLSDRKKQDESISMVDSANYLKAFIIGISQAFAIFPGVSRSGITLTASRFMGMGRKKASDYSFLLSLPIIFGGFVFQLIEMNGNVIAFNYSEIIYGMLISFLVGIATIHFFLKTISKIGLLPFAIYRVFLAIFVFAYLM